MKIKPRLLISLLILAFTIPFFAACDNGPSNIEVTFNTTSLEMYVGGRETVVATVVPEAYRDQLVWSINNADVAALSRTTGRSVTVDAVAQGTAVITVSLPGTDVNETISV
ncbi:MAG: Ig-like domain-containing protein, partial [Firmicutes bacterium]|nr:Ig-like domain-containing protein [Bacillota bacterium]